MSNTLAVWLIGLILAAFGLDYLLNDSAATVFLARKGLDLLQWIAFWR